MDIRNSLDSLKSLLGVAQPAAASTPAKSAAASTPSALPSDSATLRSAASQVALTASDSEVRMDKVNSIQAALASGTYNVPASAVASKMVNAMLGARA